MMLLTMTTMETTNKRLHSRRRAGMSARENLKYVDIPQCGFGNGV
jgi:hypothetical protein